MDPSPAMGMYGASKWALEGASQGFLKELAPFGIRVLIVQPGAFTTNMMNAVTMTEKDTSVNYKGTVVEKEAAAVLRAARQPVLADAAK